MQVILRVFERHPQSRFAEGESLLFPPGQYEIGRAARCHVRLSEVAVSRQHCLLCVTGDSATVRDLGSRNRTFVGGQQVTGERRLRHGDVLLVGPVRFEVVISLFDCYDTAPLPEVVGEALGGTIDGGRTQQMPA
jgi:pSer/pThr/pTyr-binding forkhead associated (FHA) protein